MSESADPRMQELLQRWNEEIAKLFNDYFTPATGAQVTEKEQAHADLVKQVRHTFSNSQEKWQNQPIVKLFVRDKSLKSLAKYYGVSESAVSRWANGENTVPLWVIKDMKNRVAKLNKKIPSRVAAIAIRKAYLETISTVRKQLLKNNKSADRETVLTHQHFMPINFEVWEAVVRVLGDNRWWEASQEKQENTLEALARDIRREVHRLWEEDGEMESNPHLRLWNRKLLEGWLEEWKPYILLAIGILEEVYD